MKMERRREGNLYCNDDGMKSTVRIYEQRSNKLAGYNIRNVIPAAQVRAEINVAGEERMPRFV
jgi:hypothetical protein